jgi:hypothetical protein
MVNRDPIRMDIEERKRIIALRHAARQRPHLTQCKEEPAGRSQHVYLPISSLRYSNAAALGDALIKAIVSREEALSHRTENLTVHVKNGKPLTAKGAKLLGVPWP